MTDNKCFNTKPNRLSCYSFPKNLGIQNFDSPLSSRRKTNDQDKLIIRSRFGASDSYKIATKEVKIHSTADPKNYFYYKNFRIVKQNGSLVCLGKGKTSEVFLVKSKLDGKDFAMKIINKSKIENQKSILIELTTQLKLKHHRIIELFSYSETKDFIYVILELGGHTLSSEIKTKKGIGETFSKTFMKDIIEALEFIHRNGFSHGGLNTNHILISNDSKLRLTGFKYSIEGSKRTKMDIAVDFWSLGVVLYECLTGNQLLKVRSF